MFRKSVAATEAQPKKRSRLMLGLFALVPLLVLGGGGYAAWAFLLSGQPAEAADAGHGEETVKAEAHAADDGHGAPDAIKVSALPREIAAETSLTHSYALSVLIRPKCGPAEIVYLKEASGAEAAADGLLAQYSWEAAARRATQLNEKSCGYLFGEIFDAEEKAARLLGMAAAETKAADAHH